MKKENAYGPYYGKIQELLYDGMSLKDTWKYIKKYFQVNKSYTYFTNYIKRSKLYWFMPGAKTWEEIERSEVEVKKKFPKGCTYPNCFECKLKDCRVTV